MNCDTKAYSADEVQTHLDRPTEALPAPSVSAIYRLGLVTGQRPGEISGMAVGRDRRRAGGRSLARRTKNGRRRIAVYLTPSRRSTQLRARAARASDEPRVFRGLSREAAAIAAMNTHGIRRRAASREAAARAAGHRRDWPGGVPASLIEDIAKVVDRIVTGRG